MTIIKKFGPETEVRNKFPKIWVILSCIFLLGLILVEIWVNNTTVEYGSRFEKIMTFKRVLDLENQVLENEIAKNSSLSNISSSSAQLGFSYPSSVQYIRN